MSGFSWVFGDAQRHNKKAASGKVFLKALRLKKVRRYASPRFSGGEKEDGSNIQVLGHTSIVYAKEFGATGVHV